MYGVDLAQWLADRRTRALLDYIDGLGPASRLREAIYNDPEQAVLIARERIRAEEDEDWSPGQSEALWRPSLRDWDLTAIQLHSIASQLIIMNRSRGGKSTAATDLPRQPRTLADDLYDEADRESYQDAVEVFYSPARSAHTDDTD